ncbi:MAG: T9SS type A sorting domain-containing protein [Bacteroidota bacterium]
MKNSLNLFVIILVAVFLFSFANDSESLNEIVNDDKNVITEVVKFYPHQRADTNYSEPIAIDALIPSPFYMLSGFVALENHDAQLEYRFKMDGGWSDWLAFPKNDHGKTPGRTTYLAGELDASATDIQFKSLRPFSESLTVRVFAPGFSQKNQEVQQRNAESICGCPQPNYCGRDCWCPTNDCPGNSSPTFTTTTHIIVHHSAGFTFASDYPAVVKSYWDLHVNTNGWADIGYNWLVDPNGFVYEGRGSGVQGAHFSCMNSKTMGICLIGNYENAIPAQAGMDVLKDFLAWEICDKDLDASAVSVHGSSNLNLNTISGHRDGNDSPNACGSTACPGENLYALLPDIRNDVAANPCLLGVSSERTLRANEKLEIFPNPNSGTFRIQWENIRAEEVSIYDVSGKLIKIVNELLQDDFCEVHLDATGIYFVKIKVEEGRRITQKLIVQ